MTRPGSGTWACAAVLAAALAACAGRDQPSGLGATILGEGTLDCFAAGLSSKKGEPFFCEASAAVADGAEVTFASDKPIPGSFSFFTVRLEGNRVQAGQARPLAARPLMTAFKIEGMTRTPDGAYVLATTAFDRHHPRSARLDAYNVLLAWPVGRPEEARIVAASTRAGVTSSSNLRERFARHIGKPYFKIEGLAALPGQRLVFGVREAGQDYEHFDYRILLVEFTYRIASDGEFVLEGEPRTLADIPPPTGPGLRTGLGLSSLEYDPRSGRVYVSTSHESPGGAMGAYLWHSDPQSLSRGGPLRPVLAPDGHPIHFGCKVEGIALLAEARLLLVCDDDRAVGGKYNRRPHQAPYIVIRVDSVR